MLVCSKETKSVDPSSSHFQGVSVIQNIVDPENPTIVDPETGQQVQQICEPPLKSGKPYMYVTVVSNSTGSGQDLDILIHVPEGSLPLGGKPATVSTSMHSNAFACTELTLTFYFPHEGEFSEVPATLFKGEKLLGVADRGTKSLKVCFMLHIGFVFQ